MSQPYYPPVPLVPQQQDYIRQMEQAGITVQGQKRLLTLNDLFEAYHTELSWVAKVQHQFEIIGKAFYLIPKPLQMEAEKNLKRARLKMRHLKISIEGELPEGDPFIFKTKADRQTDDAAKDVYGVLVLVVGKIEGCLEAQSLIQSSKKPKMSGLDLDSGK